MNVQEPKGIQTVDPNKKELEATRETVPVAAVRAALHGDWKGVSDQDKVKYAVSICKALNIPTPLNPFKFISMNGREVLYATKEAAELLAERNKISVNITNKYLDRDANLYVVEVRASMPGGRTFDNLAAISVAGKAGDLRANAMMKAVSKAIRRVVFSAVGLSVMDDDDIEAMKGATYPTPPPITPNADLTAAVMASSMRTAAAEQELAEEVIEARSKILGALCGKGGPFYKKVKEAKAWIEDAAGRPLEVLSADECMEVIARAQEEFEPPIENEEREPGSDDEPELPLKETK